MPEGESGEEAPLDERKSENEDDLED